MASKSEVQGWTGGGRRGADARRRFNAQREAGALATSEVETAARMAQRLGSREAERQARFFASWYPRGNGRRTFWLAVAESIADCPLPRS